MDAKHIAQAMFDAKVGTRDYVETPESEQARRYLIKHPEVHEAVSRELAKIVQRAVDTTSSVQGYMDQIRGVPGWWESPRPKTVR